MCPYLLVVHHSPTATLRNLADTVIQAAKDAADLVNATLPRESQLDIRQRHALDPVSEELRGASALIFGTSANFGYISGALKHYFDSTFLSVTTDEEYRPRSVPFNYWIRGGYDTTGAQSAMGAITTGFGWSQVEEPVCFTGNPDEHRGDLRALAANVVGAWYATMD